LSNVDPTGSGEAKRVSEAGRRACPEIVHTGEDARVYTVKQAAQVTGVPADTLRAWERRYGVVAPARSDGGYRLYDDDAIRRLQQMRALVDAGWSPARAAEHLREHADTARAPAGVPLEVLGRFAAAFDAAGTDRVLDEVFASSGFERAVDEWLMPALVRLGEAWARGEASIAGEHLVSATVQRRLAAAFEAAGRAHGAPRVLSGLPPGARHELGAMAFATAARRAGLDVVYLGSDLPEESWARAAEATGTRAVALSVPTAEDVEPARRVVGRLFDGNRGLPVYVGGGYQGDVAPGLRLLGHGIGDAAARIASDLRGDTTGAGA
jgi:DNA-binding transcriptional MerR regulator/methylmalonyl-CoA mutase cobalamin-binding subunit